MWFIIVMLLMTGVCEGAGTSATAPRLKVRELDHFPSSRTETMVFPNGSLTISGSTSIVTFEGMSPGATYYLQSTSILQSGATIYISSGNVENLNTTTLKFNDGTTQTSAASGGGTDGWEMLATSYTETNIATMEVTFATRSVLFIIFRTSGTSGVSGTVQGLAFRFNGDSGLHYTAARYNTGAYSTDIKVSSFPPVRTYHTNSNKPWEKSIRAILYDTGSRNTTVSGTFEMHNGMDLGSTQQTVFGTIRWFYNSEVTGLNTISVVVGDPSRNLTFVAPTFMIVFGRNY